LLLLDIDRFKQINDSYGHDAGDQVIKHLARILQEGTRGIDLAARIGGEEFAVILTETGLEGAIEVAERLRIAINTDNIPLVGRVAASLGVAECPSSAQTSRELMAAADAALYEAKRKGRDRVEQAPGLESNSAKTANVQ